MKVVEAWNWNYLFLITLNPPAFHGIVSLFHSQAQCLMYWRFSVFLHIKRNLPSVGVCWRRSNPPWFQNPNRPNMKGKHNYPAFFQINRTPPPINIEILTQASRGFLSLFLRNWKRAKQKKKESVTDINMSSRLDLRAVFESLYSWCLDGC